MEFWKGREEKMKNKEKKQNGEYLLAEEQPSKAITQLALPAMAALLAKAVYNIVDTLYIGQLHSDTALAAVGVTLPILLIMVSVENIFSSGAAVLAGRQLGAQDHKGASRTVTSIIYFSVLIGALLCVLGIAFINPLLRSFGASEAVLPEARDYAFWMFIAALFNLPAQSMNAAARAESSVKISTFAVVVGAVLNIVLDPIFMFDWGLGLGVEGASIATSLSQAVTFLILVWFYAGGHSIIKIAPSYFHLTFDLVKQVVAIGVPSALIQICLSLATSLTNIAAGTLPDSDLIIAAYGVVQRLVLIGCYVIMGFMQGYQPVASYSFGACREERFHACARFAIEGAVVLALIVEGLCIALARPLMLVFNNNPSVVEYGVQLLRTQVLLFPAFGMAYMMTLTYQTIGDMKTGILLSLLRQGILYVPLIEILPRYFGFAGICFAQPCADVLTIVICALLVKPMKRSAAARMKAQEETWSLETSLSSAH